MSNIFTEALVNKSRNNPESEKIFKIIADFIQKYEPLFFDDKTITFELTNLFSNYFSLSLCDFHDMVETFETTYDTTTILTILQKEGAQIKSLETGFGAVHIVTFTK